MSEPTEPNDLDLTPLAEAAAGLHELFVAYVQAGFTEDQALRILIALVANGKAT